MKVTSLWFLLLVFISYWDWSCEACVYLSRCSTKWDFTHPLWLITRHLGQGCRLVSEDALTCWHFMGVQPTSFPCKTWTYWRKRFKRGLKRIQTHACSSGYYGSNLLEKLLWYVNEKKKLSFATTEKLRIWILNEEQMPVFLNLF